MTHCKSRVNFDSCWNYNFTNLQFHAKPRRSRSFEFLYFIHLWLYIVVEKELVGRCAFSKSKVKENSPLQSSANGPRQANLVLIAYASSEGSGEPAHPCSLARTSAARSYKH